MKRILLILMMLFVIMTMAACGADSSQKSGEAEIAMIADNSIEEKGTLVYHTWESVESFAGSNALSSKYYIVDKEEKEAYLTTIEKAVNNKAKIIIMAGSDFETAVFNAQSLYPEVYFLLIDGIPHDSGGKYGASSNTIGVIFAEEQAGYMAGYAVVKDGYGKLGFMGGEPSPAVKRYGYGFIQGAAAAAQEMDKKVEITYKYMETSEPSEDVKKEAVKWYDGDVNVIFTCGGSICTSVIEAAKECGGKVIGADTDQSYLSGTVMTSAKKEIDVVINDMLENYVDGKYIGGTAFNYTAQNNGVSIEMDNGKFASFGKRDYEKLYNKFKNNEIELKKDTSVDDLKELAGEWVKLN